jgi:hypothetical protein
MRTATALIAIMFTGVLSQALATEPQPMSPSAGQSAPTPAEQQSATPAGQQSATPAPAAQPNAATPAPDSATIKPPVTVVGTKPELTPPEKELISRGYKLEMRHGEKYFCRTESDIESRFPRKNCDTAQSIEAHRLESQEALRTIQSDRSHVNN